MKIIDHGEWIIYEPAQRPLDFPSNVMFAQRVSDQKDWYEYLRTLRTDTIKMTLMRIADDWVVQATSLEADYLFPAGQRVIEIDEQGDHARFRQQIIDLDRQVFSPQVTTVSRVAFLLALHRDGSLKQVKQFIAEHADTPLQIVLDNAPMLSLDDGYLREIATALGWGDGKLRDLFNAASKSDRSDHG